MEPRTEALQVQRDRELEAVENVLRRRDALRCALDRGAGSVAGMKRKRVRRSWNHEVDRRAPRREHRGAHERAHVRADTDVRIQACVEATRKRRRPIARLPKAARHRASGAVQREPASRPIDSDLSVDALREEVVSRRHRDSEAGLAFGAAYAPAAVHLGLIGRLRAVAQANNRSGRELCTEGHVMPETGREGEVRKVDHGVRGPRGHVEAVHEVELHHAGVGDPRASQVGRAVQQRLRLQRRDGREREQSQRDTFHDGSSSFIASREPTCRTVPGRRPPAGAPRCPRGRGRPSGKRCASRPS